MKKIYLSIFCLAVLLTSCEQNSDIIETETNNPLSEAVETLNFSWWCIVEDMESLQDWSHTYGTSLQDVSVKLMYEEEVLWESNTNESGRVTIPEQVVPAEGAFILFESPGYYPLVVQIQDERIPLWRVNLIRDTYPGIEGESILDADEYITLTGLLQNPSTSRETWYYITNADDELIGNSLSGPEVPKFYMTTLPGEQLFVHYNDVVCGDHGVVELGPFTESTDIGTLLDNSFDFSFSYDLVYLDNVNDCTTGDKLYGYDLFYKIDELTNETHGNSGFNIADCRSFDNPILLSIATQNPRKYVEHLVDHSPGQQTDVPDLQACEDDDTHFQYSAGALTGGGDVFTYANILGDGQLVLKQTEHELVDQNRSTLIIDGSTEGSHTGNLNVVVRNTSSSGSWSYINGIGGHDLGVNITSNDGMFVEGNFSGEIYDADEISLGTVIGTFKARIQ